MRTTFRILLAPLALFALSGCRLVSIEAMEAAHRQIPPPSGQGDIYSYAGVANGSGGLLPDASYVSVAKDTKPMPLPAAVPPEVTNKPAEPASAAGQSNPRAGDQAAH